jgi:ABC-type antimicrobial peptide transport system permease subunit
VLQNTVERALPVFNAERPPRLKRLEAVVQQQMRLALIPSRIARFGAVSVVVLTVVGLQGLVALAVNQRIKDIAVRVALGASPWAVARYAANIGLKPAMWGLLLGIIGCFAVVRTLRAMLFGVSAFDPFSLLVSCLVLTIAVVAGVASPLIQALHIDPADNLKAT